MPPSQLLLSVRLSCGPGRSCQESWPRLSPLSSGVHGGQGLLLSTMATRMDHSIWQRLSGCVCKSGQRDLRPRVRGQVQIWHPLTPLVS